MTLSIIFKILKMFNLAHISFVSYSFIFRRFMYLLGRQSSIGKTQRSVTGHVTNRQVWARPTPGARTPTWSPTRVTEPNHLHHPQQPPQVHQEEAGLEAVRPELTTRTPTWEAVFARGGLTRAPSPTMCFVDVTSKDFPMS